MGPAGPLIIMERYSQLAFCMTKRLTWNIDFASNIVVNLKLYLLTLYQILLLLVRSNIIHTTHNCDYNIVRIKIMSSQGFLVHTVSSNFLLKLQLFSFTIYNTVPLPASEFCRIRLCKLEFQFSPVLLFYGCSIPHPTQIPSIHTHYPSHPLGAPWCFIHLTWHFFTIEMGN